MLAIEESAHQVRTAYPTRVLVVEDDPDMRSFIAETLEDDGFDVVAVRDVDEAYLELLIASKMGCEHMPAVLVTDRRMPCGDGLELITEMRRKWWWIPAVLVTGFADAEVRERARTLGSCRVLSKPFELDLIRRAVRESVRT